MPVDPRDSALRANSSAQAPAPTPLLVLSSSGAAPAGEDAHQIGDYSAMRSVDLRAVWVSGVIVACVALLAARLGDGWVGAGAAVALVGGVLANTFAGVVIFIREKGWRDRLSPRFTDADQKYRFPRRSRADSD